MIEVGIAGEDREIGERKHVGKIEKSRERGIEQVGGTCRCGRAVGRGARVEIDQRLEDSFRRSLLDDDEAPGRGIVGQAFEPVIVRERAEIDGPGLGTLERLAGRIRELHELAVALLGHDELTATDIGDAFRIVELGALRATALCERHGAYELSGLRHLHH